MRKLIYWKEMRSELHPWATFRLVPETELTDTIYLDEQIEMVKALGFSYQVIEITEVLKESRE